MGEYEMFVMCTYNFIVIKLDSSTNNKIHPLPFLYEKNKTTYSKIPHRKFPNQTNQGGWKVTYTCLTF